MYVRFFILPSKKRNPLVGPSARGQLVGPSLYKKVGPYIRLVEGTCLWYAHCGEDQGLEGDGCGNKFHESFPPPPSNIGIVWVVFLAITIFLSRML